MFTHYLKVILEEKIRSFLGYELSRVFKDSLDELFVEKLLEFGVMWSGLLGLSSRMGFFSSKLFRDFSGRKAVTNGYRLELLLTSSSFLSVFH